MRRGNSFWYAARPALPALGAVLGGLLFCGLLPAQELAAVPGEAGSPPPAAAAPASADSDSAAAESSASTITLTKVVPVYEFEGRSVNVDQYRVVAGDSLGKILKARDLLPRGADQARLMRLIRELNPKLKNLNQLTVGETLTLPTAEGEAGAAPATPPAAPVAAAPVAAVSETVKIYERPQTTQQPARVVVLRHNLGPAASSPAAADAPVSTPDAAAPPAPGVASVSAAGGGGTNLDFPSGNAGPLALEPASQVVYRTVKIRRGDTLERLLRREGLPREAIYSHLLKVTLDLNPEIKNRDLILAGTELRIPAAGDYLAAAGLNPLEVRAAALAVNQRRRPAPVTLAAGAAEGARRLPDEGAETAKNTLGRIFARLGDRVENQGRLQIGGAGEALELDTGAYPVINTLTGAKVVLDIGSTLSRTTLAALQAQNFKIFRTRRGETLDRVLDRLWPLCGYFRVYTRERAYEGGGDIRLTMAADWMIWPTEAAWNAGQPLALNKTGRGGRGTDPAWSGFLADHGVTVMDLDRNLIAPPPETPARAAAPSVVTLDSANPRFLAAELVRQFGVEPKIKTALEIKGDPPGRTVEAPLYWETGPHKVVVSFGELSPAEAVELRKSGFRVAAASLNAEAAIEAVLTGFGFKTQDSLVLKAPAGGPRMSLTIKGRVVTAPAGRKYLLTYAALPAGLTRLMDRDLKIIRY